MTNRDLTKLTVSRLDFPCSRAFRQWEAAQEGLDLPDIDTRPEWEQEFDRQHPVDRDGYSLDFLAMMERVKPAPYRGPAKALPDARRPPIILTRPQVSKTKEKKKGLTPIET